MATVVRRGVAEQWVRIIIIYRLYGWMGADLPSGETDVFNRLALIPPPQIKYIPHIGGRIRGPQFSGIKYVRILRGRYFYLVRRRWRFRRFRFGTREINRFLSYWVGCIMLCTRIVMYCSGSVTKRWRKILSL